MMVILQISTHEQQLINFCCIINQKEPFNICQQHDAKHAENLKVVIFQAAHLRNDLNQQLLISYFACYFT